MAVDAVYDTIKAYLTANIAGLADPQTNVVPPIRFENEDFTPPEDGTPWIAMALTGILYGQVSIGASRQADNRWDERGSLWLPVFVRRGTGSSHARWMAKQLADLFRGLRLLNDSIEFGDAFVGEGGATADENGNWYELPLRIDLHRTEA